MEQVFTNKEEFEIMESRQGNKEIIGEVNRGEEIGKHGKKY